MFSCPVFAQFVQNNITAYEGQNVSSVVLAGHPDLDTSNLEPLLQVHANEPFSADAVNDTITALVATGEFKGIDLALVPEANGVRVMFVLQPALYVGVFNFQGALGEFAYSRLLQVANYQSQEPYAKDRLVEAQTALTEFFNRNGFFQAEVRLILQPDEAHGIVNVNFRAFLGRRARFGAVDIQGATPQETAFLQVKLRSFMAKFRSSAIVPGKSFSLGRLERATKYLQATLGKQNYLAAQVKLIAAEYDPQTNRANVKFTVTTGPVVHLAEQGAHLWPWTKKKMIPTYTEYSVDPDLISEGERNLTSYFQSKGFFDAHVHADVQQQGDSESIVYQINRGKRNKVEAVKITGNRQVKDEQLRGQLKVEKKPAYNPFSHGDFSQKLVQESAKNLKTYYQNSGFPDVVVTPQVKRDNKGDLSVIFAVTEGTRDTVTALNVVGNNTMPMAKIAPKGLKLGPGKPYSGELVQEDRNEIIANYLRNGYLNATFLAKPEKQKSDPHHLAVTYQIQEGPQVIATSVVTEGRSRTKQWLIDRGLKIRAGQPLSENGLLSSETSLYELNTFDWAAVEPRQPITSDPHTEAVVKVHEAKPNTITYGFGFEVIKRGGSVPGGFIVTTGISVPKGFETDEQTFYGPRGTFTYSRNNLRGVGDVFSVGGFAGRLDQRGSTSYTIPHFLQSDWQLGTSLTGEHNSENPIFTTRDFDSALQFQRALNKKKTKNVFLRYNFRESSLSRVLSPDLVPSDERRVQLSGPSFSLVDDNRDNPLDAHRGLYHSYEIGANPSFLGSNFSFAKFLGQTAYYRPLVKGIIWANSIRVGLEEPFSGSKVPISEEFFSGGGSTLRDFALDQAGPQRTVTLTGSNGSFNIAAPAGGIQLLILNSEFRIPVPIKPGLGVAAFYDGGNVFPHIGFHGGCGEALKLAALQAMKDADGCNYSNGVGLGVRYATPIGPIRVDLGRNLDPPPGVTKTQYFITIGQAF